MVIQDLHGPWRGETPCWPTPYRYAVDSDAFRGAVLKPVLSGADACWEHGILVAVASEARRDALGEQFGTHRVANAQVGAPCDRPLGGDDRQAMMAFCARGWRRLLVRAFEHVGAKAGHLGCLTPESLAPFGALGDAILAARDRHRLALLEELIASRTGGEEGLFAELDAMDRALDATGAGESWVMSQVPEHCHTLWPLRNLMRLADRRGVVFRDVSWQAYEDENTYAPELPILALEPDIYGAAIEHDIMHYAGPVLWSSERVAFEVANNGGEGDAQAMNNLILASWHTGPSYEGYAGWPGATLFEWLERAFGVAGIPQTIAALRTFTVVLHREFTGDARVVLSELVPTLVDGEHLDGLLRFYPGYVQHDHDFLGAMHPRYLTPVFAEWREVLGQSFTEDWDAFVEGANAVLWMLEDLDLRTWSHPLRGMSTSMRELHRITIKKGLELRHLADTTPAMSDAHRDQVKQLVNASIGLDAAFTTLCDGIAADVDEIPPAERDPDALAGYSVQVGALAAQSDTLRLELQGLVAALRVAQEGWPAEAVRIPEAYLEPQLELFRGVYYAPAIHIGSDDRPGPKVLGEYETVG